MRASAALECIRLWGGSAPGRHSITTRAFRQSGSQGKRIKRPRLARSKQPAQLLDEVLNRLKKVDESVTEQGEQLQLISSKQDGQGKLLQEQGEQLQLISSKQEEQGKLLQEQGEQLQLISSKQEEQGKLLQEQGEQLQLISSKQEEQGKLLQEQGEQLQLLKGLPQLVGDVFESVVSASPADGAGITDFTSLGSLLAELQLPPEVQKLHKILVQGHRIPLEFRRLLLEQLRKVTQAQALASILQAWRTLPSQPSSHQQWEEEALMCSQALRCLEVNSPLHRATRLWQDYCRAAAADAAEEVQHGSQQSEAHGNVLCFVQRPFLPQQSAWPPDMSFALAACGCLAPVLALDAPFYLRDGSSGQPSVVVVIEAKSSKSAIGDAQSQLRRTVALLGWVYAVLGRTPPLFVGRIVLPPSQQRSAWLANSTEQVALPHAAFFPGSVGPAAVRVVWELAKPQR